MDGWHVALLERIDALQRQLTPSWLDVDAPIVVLLLLIAILVSAMPKAIRQRYFVSPTRMELVGFGHWKHPSMWFRTFSHIFGHQDFGHIFNNAMLLLVIGPACEAAYGSAAILKFVLISAVTSSIVTVVFAGSQGCSMGASGVVFMLVLLSSLTKKRAGMLPLTLLLVAPLKLWGEVCDMGSNDGVSHLGHLSGGVLGIVLGLSTVSRIERLEGLDVSIGHAARGGWGFCTRCLNWCLAS